MEKRKFLAPVRIAGLVDLMAFIGLKPAELLDFVSNPADLDIDLSSIPAEADMDNLVVTA